MAGGRTLTSDAELDEQALNLDKVLRDLREANAQLIVSNLKSQDLARELSLLYDEATEAIKENDAFFAQVSHELRTPLTSISGWAALLGIHVDPPTVAEAARSISTSAAIQAKLVNDLHDVSRIRANKFEVTVEEIDFRTVADDAASSIRPLLAAKDISLQTAIEEAMIDGDGTRLRQVLDNLLSNALKFTPKGGVIDTRLRIDGPNAVLQIRDTGEGISSDFLPHIFKRHAQAAPGRFGGLGLGLAIAKHIVELHGGTIAAESPGKGKGATFTIRIPAIRRD